MNPISGIRFQLNPPLKKKYSCCKAYLLSSVQNNGYSGCATGGKRVCPTISIRCYPEVLQGGTLGMQLVRVAAHCCKVVLEIGLPDECRRVAHSFPPSHVAKRVGQCVQ